MRLPNRRMVEAILWRHRTGAPWRDLPEEFGPWTSVHTRFDTWNKRGVWQDVLEWLRREADLEWVMIVRSLATRFDKSARSFAAQVAMACVVVWLKL